MICKFSARYKHGQLLDFSIEWTWIGRLISWTKMYPTLALSGPNLTKVIAVAACPPEEAFPVITHLFELAGWHQEKSILKNSQNNAKNSRKNIWNESTIHFSTAKGGKDIWHPKHTEKSPGKTLRAEIGSDFCGSFGLQPQRYRHLQGLRCMEMNNINGYNKTKQQMESESSFIPSKMCCQSHNPFFSIRLGENLQFNFQSLRELRS